MARRKQEEAVDKLAHHFDEKKQSTSSKKNGWGAFWNGTCGVVCGAFQLAVVFADFAAAYILFFQGSPAMQIVAGILVAHGSIVSASKFLPNNKKG